ncbi:hypothetical protein [Sinomonas atrocyanea]
MDDALDTVSPLIRAEIEDYAKTLADMAPPIGEGQAKLLASLFARRGTGQEAA